MKRLIKFITVIVLIMIVAAVGFTAYLAANKKFANYEEELAYRDGVIETLNTKIDTIGGLITCYELNYDVKSGTIIEESDLTAIEIPEKSSIGYITDINEVLGKRYKTNLGIGTVLHSSLVTVNELTADSRYIDVPIDPTRVPIGLEPGDYIDIRITFTRGQDFIAMTHKEVVQINNNIIKVVGSEIDNLTLVSMKKDVALYVDCNIYAVQYVEGGVQESAVNYYPIRLDTLASAAQNKGFNWESYSESNQFNLENRELLERTIIEFAALKIKTETLDEKVFLDQLYAAALIDGNAIFSSWYQSGIDYYTSIQNGGTGNGSSSESAILNGDQKVTSSFQ